MKILVPQTSFHHTFEPLPDGVELVNEPEAQVEMAVLGMEQAAHLASLIPALPQLRVVQSLNSGIEWLLPMVPDGITVCNASGVHDAAVAEWVVAVLLAMRRRLPDLLDLQRRSAWDINLNDVTATGASSIGAIDTLEGGTSLIIGYGSIGRAVASRLAALGIHVVGVARSPRPDTVPPEAIPRLLPDMDAVILLAPLTPATERLVDAKFLACMKPGAILVNASRGRLVDTDALIHALRQGSIRAALDVTDPEPLPPTHPLWQAPNVLITPHVAGAVASWRARAYRFARSQVDCYVSGKPLRNIVSRE